MKKYLAVIVLAVAALVLIATGVVFAQPPQPPVPGNGGRGPMRLHALDGQEGPLHDYMVKAMAEALGITTDEFESRREAGETAYQIALAEGIAADKIPALLQAARAKALDAALAAGVITRQQADWMKSRSAGMGMGYCGGAGPRFGMGMGGGGRWGQSNP